MENNQLHQSLITTKEDCAQQISQMSLQLRQLEGKLNDAMYLNRGGEQKPAQRPEYENQNPNSLGLF
jgi:hypothetical protein